MTTSRSSRILPDAFHHEGNVDRSPAGVGVPLSVWPGSAQTTVVVGAVIEEFSRPGDQVVAWESIPGLLAGALSGRVSLLVTCNPNTAVLAARAVKKLPATAQALAKVVTGPAAKISSLIPGTGCRDLVVVDGQFGPVPWLTVASLPRPKGYVAVIAESVPPEAHHDLIAAAGRHGLGYFQHVVAVAGAELDQALAAEGGLARASGVPTHRRVHTDVHVFVRPDGAAA